MARNVWAHLSPNSFQPNDLRGGIAVVIDVLRASTTICHALAAGARAVVPCQEVDEARRIAADYPAGNVLLGGERGGQLIDGFDLDNSPLKYTAEMVEDKTIVFTTSNGTQALLRSREADRVLIGAFVNLTAVVRLLADEQRPVHLVCAGKDADISAEDVLCAGALAAGLQSANSGPCRLNDPAQIAAGFFMAHANDDDALHAAIGAGRNGRDLQRLGFEADIRRAATRDLFDIFPEFLPESGRIEGLNQAASK